MSEAEALLMELVERGNICMCSDRSTCLPCKAEALLIRAGHRPKVPTLTLQDES